MTEKRQPPLWLDMSSTEAMERFAGTDLVEAREAEQAAAAKRKAGSSTPPPELPAEKTPRKRGRPRNGD